MNCEYCLDTSLYLNAGGWVNTCPRQWHPDHPGPNAAAEMLFGTIRRQQTDAKKIAIDAFRLARLLTRYASDRPCPTDDVLRDLFSETALDHTARLRKLHHLVEELRRVWMLPVGSRKEAPSGYWIITDIEDCKRWLHHATSAPITQLATIWKAARAAFPVLAGQQEFSFMDQLGDPDI
jgi:hypothetical protein